MTRTGVDVLAARSRISPAWHIAGLPRATYIRYNMPAAIQDVIMWMVYAMPRTCAVVFLFGTAVVLLTSRRVFIREPPPGRPSMLDGDSEAAAQLESVAHPERQFDYQGLGKIFPGSRGQDGYRFNQRQDRQGRE